MARDVLDHIQEMEADPLEAASLLANAEPGRTYGSKGVAGSGDEHALAPRQAIKAYPMAVLWTLAVSMTVIMEGVRIISPPPTKRL